MENTEIWYDIPGYEGCYQLSSNAEIKSLKRYVKHKSGGVRVQYERIIKQHSNKKTHHISFKLSKNGIAITTGLHVVVALVHIPNPLNLPIVEHKNDDPSDNRPENLEWGTCSSNVKNCYNRGRSANIKGENHGQSKLTEKDVLNIIKSELLQKQLSKIYGVGQDVISRIKSRKTWKHIQI